MLEIIPWVVACVCIGILFAVDLFFPALLRRPCILWVCIGGVMGLALAYNVWAQYAAWRAMPGQNFLLPPYTSITYFVAYAGARIVAPYILSLCIGIFVWKIMHRFNKRYSEKFFYEEELIIAPLAFFLIGYPGVLIYILFFLMVFTIWSVIHSMRSSGNAVTSMRFLWLPLALCVILLNGLIFSQTAWWGLLKV